MNPRERHTHTHTHKILPTLPNWTASLNDLVRFRVGKPQAQSFQSAFLETSLKCEHQFKIIRLMKAFNYIALNKQEKKKKLE